MNYVFFHPFKRTACTKVKNGDKVIDLVVDPVLSWRKANVNNIFYLDTPDEELTKPYEMLMREQEKATLYIIGQCAAGHNRLHSMDLSSSVSSQELVDILAERFLPQGGDVFRGKLKIYACHSASRTEESFSFATSLCKILSTSHQDACQIYGYSVPVSVIATTRDNRSSGTFSTGGDKVGQHRWVMGSDNGFMKIRTAQVKL